MKVPNGQPPIRTHKPATKLWLTFFATVLATVLAMSLSVSVRAEDRFANVEMKATHVAGTVHMLVGQGGNIGVSVGADGTLIVDDQFAPLADKIAAALTDLDGDRPRLILNTHFHGDHTGANPAFGTTGTIIAHDNVRVRLLATPNFPREGLPLVTYDDDVTVHFNDETIKLVHLPAGHTDGDTVVWFQTANVIHMGDHFFNGFFPYIDIGSGGTIDGFISNVERVLNMVPADIRIIPGHGPLASVADLRKSVDTIKRSSAQIRAAVAAGQDDADIAAQLDRDFPGWGAFFINSARWTQIVKAGYGL